MDKENINDAPRDKLRSYSTLNSLYYETQQEIELLNKQIRVKDNIISELKVRLGRYESIYLTAGNNEPVVFGPSKCLLESLCEEVWNPQQKLKDMEQKASRQAEVNICLQKRVHTHSKSSVAFCKVYGARRDDRESLVYKI